VAAAQRVGHLAGANETAKGAGNGEWREFLSAPGPIRTADLSLRRRALYPLSYGRLCLQTGTFVWRRRAVTSGVCVPFGQSFAHASVRSALDEGAVLGDLVLVATHRLSIDLECEPRIGVTHLSDHDGRALPERVQQRAGRASEAVSRELRQLETVDTYGSMSEKSTAPDLVDLTREVIEAQGIDRTMRFYAPDSVYDLSDVGLGVFEGYSAIRAFLNDWLSSYDEAEDEAEELVELSNGVVFAVVREYGHPSDSARHVQIHGRHAAVVVWADSLIVRVNIYRDVDDARAAAECLAEDRAHTRRTNAPGSPPLP
jgi:hypothetical protein